jgi:hypothetical protein
MVVFSLRVAILALWFGAIPVLSQNQGTKSNQTIVGSAHAMSRLIVPLIAEPDILEQPSPIKKKHNFVYPNGEPTYGDPEIIKRQKEEAESEAAAAKEYVAKSAFMTKEGGE